MNTNTIIWTDIRKYKYNHTQKNIFMFMDIKAIRLCKLIHICAMIYNLWWLVYNKKKFKILILFNIFF